MNILVLGSAGQIGCPLVNYLKKENNQVFEFDIISNKDQDLRIPSILDKVLENIDFVFFLAFDVGGSHYLNTFQSSYNFISNNIKIMNNTFDSLKKFNTPFIFSSSQMADLTNSEYGILKKIGEKYTYSLDNGKIVRFWNVYGVEKDPLKFHVITDFILMARNEHQIIIKTSGKESRQFLYVEDCCECLNILANKFSKIREKELDISSFDWISILDLAKEISYIYNNCPVYVSDKKDNLQRDKLKNPRKDILKYWIPKTSIKEGVKIINQKI
jgi:nucleoside-diphosphate-sugar epimerase